MTAVRRLLTESTQRLAAAGVESPRADAHALLAFVLDEPLGRLALVDDVDETAKVRFAQLIERRATRIPLQHLTGQTTFRYSDLVVGPGVFVPRPETESLVEWVLTRLRELPENPAPVVVDLCTGSGAIAAAMSDEHPSARVYAVELDPGALAYAEQNLARRGVELVAGDMAEALPGLSGTVDVVTCNPPYIPLDCYDSVAIEARDFDPSLALWSGEDGLDAFRVLEKTAARLLKVGGWLAAEHADVQAETAPAVFAATQRWVQLRDHVDLAGRPRFVTARLAR